MLLVVGAYAAPPATLAPPAFAPLRLGSVVPSGWLLRQLRQQANSLSGHLSLFWPDVNDSAWIGGKHDPTGGGLHERGPYWLNGVVPLAALLNASGAAPVPSGAGTTDVVTQVEQWVTYILDHQNATTGWLGPDDVTGGNQFWATFNVISSLLMYAESHHGQPSAQRAQQAALRHVLEATRRMRATPLSSWSQARWQDWLLNIEWLLDSAPQGQEAALMAAASLAYEQRFDWGKYYARDASMGSNVFPLKNVPSWGMWTHGVNNAQAVKWGAVAYRLTRNASQLAEAKTMLAMQDAYHGQPHGMFSGDECFGGRALNRGIELCAIVEQMYSLQVAFRISGDLSLLDRTERIAYNALPATLTADMWQHQYLQQANEISACTANPHVWQTDGPDSTLFGVEPNFGCCTVNFNQGWPKFAASTLVRRPTDGAVLVALLAPVTATLDGNGATITVDTLYPFGDVVNVTLTVPSTAANPQPLLVRVPGWAAHATYSIDATSPRPAPNGTMVEASCAPGKSLTLRLDLKPSIVAETGWGAYKDRNVFNGTVDKGGYSPWVGALPAGGDLHSGNYTLAEAEAFCNATDACVGFTFRAASAAAGAAAVDEAEAAAEAAMVEAEAGHHDHHHHHAHGHGGGATRRDRPHAAPPPPPDASAALMADGGKATVYFKRAFTPNTDKGWRSYAKIWADSDTNALTVTRGPLVYALQLVEEATQVKQWQPFGNVDLAFSTPSVWNYALVADPSKPEEAMTFERVTPVPPAGVFNASAPPMRIRAKGVALPRWRETYKAAAEPPPSPVDMAAHGAVGKAGEAVDVMLVPYGATELRMAAMPWAKPS